MDAIAGRAKGQDIGVYSFWTAGGRCLYIGRSTNLDQRIPSSFREHIPKRQRENTYLRTCITKTTADMAVAEMILIAVHKPELNKDGCFDSELTLQVEVPVWSEPTLMGRPNHNPVLDAKLRQMKADYTRYRKRELTLRWPAETCSHDQDSTIQPCRLT